MIETRSKSQALSLVPLSGALPAIISVLILAAVTPFSWAAPCALIRVNQLGYESGSSSRAYLMTRVQAASAGFQVIRSDGVPVFSGTVGEKLGDWGEFLIYPLDFKIQVAGSYRINVEAPAAARSPSFPIDRASALYSQSIANALYFYENERDGPNFIPTPLRSQPGHVNDRAGTVFNSPSFDANDLILGNLEPTGEVVDVSGGWWDAGDYLKFVETHSYAVALMLIGIRDFPAVMGNKAGASNFTAEARFGLDWLNKMWDDPARTLFYQVGIGTDFLDNPNLLSDHDLWRLPQRDDSLGGEAPSFLYVRHRPVFLAGPAGSKISPNLAGRLAADFAECFQVFKTSDPQFASACLLSGEHILDLADTAPEGNLLTTAPFDFYGETEWRDDLELGATELYFAVRGANQDVLALLPHSDPLFYLRAAAHWAKAYIEGPNDASDTLNLYDVSGLAHFELLRAMGAAQSPAGLEVSPSELVGDLEKQLGNAIAQASRDAFGFGFPWNTYDTATHGAGLSVMASEYSRLTGSHLFDDYARRWAANILGANAWGSSLIVGDGERFPDCMQHQVANIVGSLNGGPPILRGALVEGPNSFAAEGFLDGMRVCPANGKDVFLPFNAGGAVYRDDQQSYSTVEPAIDLTAPSFLMFAWRIEGTVEGLPSEQALPELEHLTPNTAQHVWRVPERHRRYRSR